jgi:hypothetical protein
MDRRPVTLLVMVLVLLGCSKKRNDSDSVSRDDDPLPTGPAYTIKLRDDKTGDKVSIVESIKQTITVDMTGAKKNVSKTQKSEERSECIETILVVPPGATSATKATRAYKKAEKSKDGGPMRPLSYSGKTVHIEKKAGGFTFTVNGKPLFGEEAKKFKDLYDKSEKFTNEDMLPKKAVQVNEKWPLDQLIISKLSKEFDAPMNAEKSHGTGRLTKAYKKGDQQWGVIEIKLEVALDASKGGANISGTLNMTTDHDPSTGRRGRHEDRGRSRPDQDDGEVSTL